MKNKYLQRILASVLSASLLLGHASPVFAGEEVLLEASTETEVLLTDTTDNADSTDAYWSIAESEELETEPALEDDLFIEDEDSFIPETAPLSETVDLEVAYNFEGTSDDGEVKEDEDGPEPGSEPSTEATPTGGYTTDYYGSQLTDPAHRKVYDKRVQSYLTQGKTGNADFTFADAQKSPFFVDFTEIATVSGTAEKGYTFTSVDRDSAVYQQLKADLTKAMQASEDAFLYDHPELYWYRPGKFTYYMMPLVEDGKIYCYISKIVNKPQTIYTGAEKEAAAYQSSVNTIVSQIRSLADYKGDQNPHTMELIQAAHDWLCDRFYYDSDAYYDRSYLKDSRIFSSMGAFVDGVGTGVVCEGYAKSFKVIMDQLGIPCVLISGKASSGIGHMWNAVQYNGKWYMMDLTWDDQKSGGLSGIKYDYYLSGNDTYGHRADGTFIILPILLSLLIPHWKAQRHIAVRIISMLFKRKPLHRQMDTMATACTFARRTTSTITRMSPPELFPMTLRPSIFRRLALTA